MKYCRNKGFSLLEVLLVLVLLAIIISYSIITYNSYKLRANRTDAIKTLLAIQIAEEKHRIDNDSYASLATVWGSTNSIEGHYTLATSNISATTYTITATAQGEQTADTECTTMTLAFATGTTTRTPAACWLTN